MNRIAWLALAPVVAAVTAGCQSDPQSTAQRYDSAAIPQTPAAPRRRRRRRTSPPPDISRG